MRKKVRFLFCLLTLLTFHRYSQAQSEFLPGWVITAQGDTLVGEVAYRGVRNKATGAVYRPLLGNELREFSPEQAKSFGFVGRESYHALNLPIAGGTALVFAQALVKGKANLYLYGEQFFADGNGMEPFLIEVSSSSVMVEGTRRRKSSTQHLGLLKLLMQDCRNLPERYFDAIRDVVNARLLALLFEQYNQCVDPNFKTDEIKETPWNQIEVGLLGGMTNSQLQFSGQPDAILYDFLFKATYQQETAPAFGVSLNFSSPRLSRRFSLQTELWGYNRSFQGYYENASEFSSLTDRNDVFLQYRATRIGVAFRYTHLRAKSKFEPFLQAGVAVAALSDQQVTRFRDLENRALNPVIVSFSRDEYPSFFTNTQFVPWGSIGLRYRLTNHLLIHTEVRGQWESSFLNPNAFQLFNVPTLTIQTLGAAAGLVWQW